MMHQTLLLVIGLLVAGGAWADTYYKIEEPDGTVRYADQPPADTVEGRTVTEVERQRPVNTINPDEGMGQWMREKARREKRAQEEEHRALAGWQRELQAAEERLAEAEAAYEAGKDPQEGDMVGIANRFGGSSGARPSEEFLQRVKELEAAVEAARENLEAVRARKPEIDTKATRESLKPIPTGSSGGAKPSRESLDTER